MSIKPALLLVDDDSEFVDILNRRFLQLGFAVTAVHHPRQAMEAASFNEFDVAVIDQGLPETVGLNLMDHMRTHLDVQVIILSGFDDLALKREALQRGAFAYLLKPCTLAELASVVDQALHAAPISDSGQRQNVGFGNQPPHVGSSSHDRCGGQSMPSKALEVVHAN